MIKNIRLKVLCNLEKIQTPNHLWSKSTFGDVNISRIGRFNFNHNQFTLEANGPAKIGTEEITLHFSIKFLVDIHPTYLDFGSVRLPFYKNRSVILRNAGNIPLTITKASFNDNQFSLVGKQDLPLLLEPGKQQAVQVRFRPQALDVQTCKLVFWSHGIQHTTVQLQGIGLESYIEITAALKARILEFFNKKSLTTTQITNRIQDDPSFLRKSDLTYGVRWETARNILQHREGIGGRFTSIYQLDKVSGIGPDTFHDILYSFLESH